MSDKKTYQQEEQIRRYLDNEMTSTERNAFEREMQKDPFLADAVDGLSAFPTEEIISDIQYLKVQIRKNKPSSRRFIWYAAASVLVIAVSTFILFNIDRKTNVVLTENVQQPTSNPQEGIIQEPLNLQKNETEQKVTSPEKTDNTTAKFEIASTRTKDTSTQISSTKKETKGSLFNPNLPEQLKIKKSFSLAENIQIEKNDTQIQTGTQQTTDEIASEDKPLIQTVSIRGIQRTSKAARAENNAMQFALADTQLTQKGTVSGIVTDSQGDPLPGVAIYVKGTNHGAITNPNGEYLIPNVQDTNSLVYSFIGMKTEEIPYTSSTPMNVTLKNDDSSLSEVVVVGYGTTKKAELTGSVAGIDVSTTSANHKASPLMGWKAYNDYLKQQLAQPNLNKADRRVAIRLVFEVDSTGQPGSFKILSSDNEKLNNEAIRIVEEGPVWLPASQNSVSHSEQVKLKLVFPAQKQ